MMSFEDFQKQFNFDDADDCWEKIKRYDDYVSAAKKQYSSIWTYCSRCRKMVRRADVNVSIEKSTSGELKRMTRCKHCNTLWYIHDVKDGDSEGVT